MNAIGKSSIEVKRDGTIIFSVEYDEAQIVPDERTINAAVFFEVKELYDKVRPKNNTGRSSK